MAVTKIKPVKSTLSKTLDYIPNPEKTEEKMLVSFFGCSFEPGEVDYQTANEKPEAELECNFTDF